MNLWIKIGVPVLIAALLVISAVGITLGFTAGNSDGKVAAASYDSGVAGSSRLADGSSCANCSDTTQDNCCGTSGQTTTARTSRGGCCGSR